MKKDKDQLMPELRQDPVSGEWIILSPGRSRRPQMLDRRAAAPRKPAPKKGCPFEDLPDSGNGTIFSAWPNLSRWQIAVIPNKYPALMHGETHAVDFRQGIYSGKTGVGTHELIVTRDHNRSFADLSPSLAARVLEVVQDRYRFANDGKNAYAVAFLNYGPSVGSSLWHPHYQLMAVPFVPPHVARSIGTAERYFRDHRRCIRCVLIKEELRHRTRIVDQNTNAVAFAPYASRRPFEVTVMPKRHRPRFEDEPKEVVADVAALMQLVLRRLRKHVQDPDLNFFIHSAPLGRKEYPHHHWHAEILPHLSYLGGLEFATGIYVNVADPDEVAKVLKGERP